MRGTTLRSGLVGAGAILALVLVLAGSALAASTKPLIASFAPASGKAGTKVTVTGKNLTGATAVKIGSATATFSVSSSTRLTLTVPSKVKSGKISVTTKGGKATSKASFKA